MTFLKSVTDKEGITHAEPHDEPNISSFKTTRYPYALPFKDEEDNHGLHLSGLLAVFGIIEDYQLAFFSGSDWYAEMNTDILARNRELIAKTSYDDNIVGRDTEEEQGNPTFSTSLWEDLNAKPGGSLSVLEKLRAKIGMKIVSVELVSIDPPEGWRATTLAPYKAQRDRDAAKYEAEASATRFDDTNQALKTWLADQKAAKHKPTQAQIEAKQDELRQRALAKTPGYHQIHVKGLENATTAVVGGGAGTGVMIGAQGGKPAKGNPPSDKGASDKGPGRSGLMSQEEAAEAFFGKHGVYPKWDPQKREPHN